jgi:type III secretion protein N (ATPase)
MQEQFVEASELDAIMPVLKSRLYTAEPRPVRGRVKCIRGIMVHATLTQARVGELCYLRDPLTGRSIPAEVVGFEQDEALLTPVGALDGMSTRTEVISTGESMTVAVGDHLLGAVISPTGERLDHTQDACLSRGAPRYPLQAEPPAPFERSLIKESLQLGIRAIDGLMTVARGQRIGIFGEPGIGKSSLLASIVKGTEADVIVLGLIGERGREVRELLDVQLGARARARTVAVVATSDRPAIERVKAAYVATSIAEYYRDQGKNVLLLMDSITRYARAQREIGLAAGEPPTRRGYPPSFFAALPRLLERAGPGLRGTITALYTVLTEGDGTLDPVAEETKSILDGHIMLSAELAQKNHFPAIDVLRSRSRLMDTVTSSAHQQWAGQVRELLARYADIELLLKVGEYVPGTDAKTDKAIAQQSAIEDFLRQPAEERAPMAVTLRRLARLAS